MPTNIVTLQQQFAQSGSWVIPLLVGGGLTLVGTFATQCFSLVAGHLERRSQARKLHIAKLEELAECVGSTLKWFQTLSACNTVSDVNAASPIAARRMVTLCLLYFPELLDTIAEYSNGLLNYYHFAIDCLQHNSPLSLGAQMAKHPRDSQWNDKLILLRQACDDEIANAAQKYR